MDNKKLVYCPKCGRARYCDMGGSISIEQSHKSGLYLTPFGTQTLNCTCGYEGSLVVKNIGTEVQITWEQTGTMTNN